MFSTLDEANSLPVVQDKLFFHPCLFHISRMSSGAIQRLFWATLADQHIVNVRIYFSIGFYHQSFEGEGLNPGLRNLVGWMKCEVLSKE